MRGLQLVEQKSTRYELQDQGKVSENNEIEYISKIKMMETDTKTLREERKRKSMPTPIYTRFFT